MSAQLELAAVDAGRLNLSGDGSDEAALLVAAAEADRLQCVARVDAQYPGSGIGAPDQPLGTSSCRLVRDLCGPDVRAAGATAIDKFTRTGDLRMPFAGYVEPHDPLTHPLPPDLLCQITDRSLNILEPFLGVAALESGRTFVYNSVDARVPTLVHDSVNDVATATRSSVQINAYVSRGLAPGFGRHWDDHDVLVTQLSGRKYWEVHQPAQLGAVRQFTPDDSAGEVVWSGILEPGSALFIPRGWSHGVHGFADETSVHLTYGINRLTVLAALSLIGAERFGPGVAAVSVDDLEHAFGEWRSRCMCLPRLGPIEAARLIDANFADVALHVRLIGGAIFAPDECTTDDLVLMANRRRVTLPRRAVPAVAWLLQHPGSTVEDLTAAVGRSDVHPPKVLVGLGEAGLLQAEPLR